MVGGVARGPTVLALCRIAVRGHALGFEALGAIEPSLGHPAPGRPARRIARELRHLLTIGGVPQEFFGWIHGSLPLLTSKP